MCLAVNRALGLILGVCLYYVCGVRLVILDRNSVMTCDRVLTGDLDLNE